MSKKRKGRILTLGEAIKELYEEADRMRQKEEKPKIPGLRDAFCCSSCKNGYYDSYFDGYHCNLYKHDLYAGLICNSYKKEED